MTEWESAAAARRRPRSAATLAVLLMLFAHAPASGAPSGQELPAAFASLLGRWTGEGTLFGREARYQMQWSRALDDRFVHLEFSNSFVGEQPGDLVPVLTASAYYRPDPDDAEAASGMWFDTRGVILPLSAAVAADSLTTLWGDEATERGRTTYRITGVDQVEVTDEVMREGEYVVFARASFTRMTE